MAETSFALAGLIPQADLVYSASGQVLQLGKNCLVIKCPSTASAMFMTNFVQMFRVFWAVFFAIHLSRYLFQIFGNVPIRPGGFLGMVFSLSRYSNRFFLGILPCIYGIDLGALLGFYLFDRIDMGLANIAVVDHLGKSLM